MLIANNPTTMFSTIGNSPSRTVCSFYLNTWNFISWFSNYRIDKIISTQMKSNMIFKFLLTFFVKFVELLMKIHLRMFQLSFWDWDRSQMSDKNAIDHVNSFISSFIFQRVLVFLRAENLSMDQVELVRNRPAPHCWPADLSLWCYSSTLPDRWFILPLQNHPKRLQM